MKKRSLVLITVDCLRADHMGFYGYPRPVSPFLDSLAKESAVLSDAIVAGVPTYFSFPAILASRYPLGLGRDVVGIAPQETTIATTLRNSGYRTAAFLAGNPYLVPGFGYDQGFQTFEDFLDTVPTEETDRIQNENGNLSGLNRRLARIFRKTRTTQSVYTELYFWYCQWRTARQKIAADGLRPYPAADTMIESSCSWLRENARSDFFLWIHLMDTHHPHYPPQEALAALGMSDMTVVRQRFLNSFWNRRDLGSGRLKRYVDEMVALYDASVRWVDGQISRIVQTLRELGRWNETVFALTADHGEEFLEHGGRYHSPTSPIEPLIHVPLLIHGPDAVPLNPDQGTFSLIHLAPTLLEGLGVNIPSSFQGRSYWAEIQSGNFHGDAAILETVGTGAAPGRREQQMMSRVLTVRDQQYKLVLRFAEQKVEMFDLKHDPGESHPVAESAFPKERSRLLEIARDHLQNSRTKRDKNLALNARIRSLRHSLRPSPASDQAAM